MKNLILISALVLSAFAFSAPSAEKKAEMIAKRKARITERISQRVNSLELNKNCINSANSKDDFKKCRSEHKSRMQSLKEKFKADRSSRKAQREQRRAKRKAEREARKNK